MKKTVALLFFGLVLMTHSWSQESVIKAFAETRISNKFFNALCLYPSTLRMINVAENPAFNELVNDIEKVLIFTLDSTTIHSKSYRSVIKEYEALGFEEYLSLTGVQEVKIVGKKNEYIGIMATKESAMAFYMKGDVPFGKIPELIQTFQSSDMLPLIADRFK